MSAHNPPIPFPLNPIFNPNDWIYADEFITQAGADARYLKKAGDTATGLIIFNAGLTSNAPISLTGALNTDRIINNVFYQLQDKDNLTLTMGQIYGSTGVFNYDNDINSGSHRFAVNNSSGTQVIPLEISSLTTSVNPSITFPDGKVQNSAFTGAGAFAGSYTLSNITLDANGKITSISNGSAGTQFVPKFHTFANYQTGSGFGYSQGAYINWSSGWGSLDYVIIRVRAQVNWGNTGSGWQNYATTAGELILRPHFAPSGVIGSLNTPNQFYTTNSGSVIGNVGKLAYYTGAINNGTQSYFYLYGNGGSGGGASGYIQLMCNSPQVTGGWQYTCSYEYILHSTSGASITFSNGVGTNNSLP